MEENKYNPLTIAFLKEKLTDIARQFQFEMCGYNIAWKYTNLVREYLDTAYVETPSSYYNEKMRDIKTYLEQEGINIYEVNKDECMMYFSGDSAHVNGPVAFAYAYNSLRETLVKIGKLENNENL